MNIILMKVRFNSIAFLSFLSLTASEAAITAIGTTGTLDRAKKFQERVAVPGHDDNQAWSSSFDLGASLTRGNSETLFITASLTIDRDFRQYEFFGNLTYAYGEDEDSVTEDELILTLSLSKLLTENGIWFYGARLDGQQDDLADIEYRLTFSTFLGHYLIKRPNDTLTLSTEAGVGINAESVGEDEESFGVLYLGQRFNYWITDFTRLYEGLAFFGEIDDVSSFVLIGEAGIETFLSDSLSFKAYVQSRFDSTPAMDRRRNDLRVVSGLSYKF